MPALAAGHPAQAGSARFAGQWHPQVAHRRRRGWLSKFCDYVELTKPQISVVVLVTVAVSMFVAAWGPPSPWLLVNTLLGTALVAASASALNQ